MKKYGSSVVAASLLALAGGWFAGSSQREADPVGESFGAPRPVLTALGKTEPRAVPASVWAALDAAADESEFPELLVELDIETLRAMLEQPPRWSSSRWWKLISEIRAQIVKIDPERALDIAEEQNDLWLIRLGFIEMAKTLDPEALVARLRSIKDPFLREQAVRGMVNGLAEVDPQRALTFLQTQAPGMRDSMLGFIYAAWAKADPEAATAAALAYADPIERGRAIHGIAGTMHEIDPVAAIAWVQGLEDGAAGSAALGKIFSSLARTDPQLAAAELLKLDPGDLRRFAQRRQKNDGVLPQIFEALGAVTASQASVEFFSALPAYLRVQLLSHDPLKFFGGDAQTALTFAELLPTSSDSYNRLMGGAISEIAKQDHRKALELLAGLPDRARSQVMPDVFATWLKQDPGEAFQFLTENPESLPDLRWSGEAHFAQLKPLLGNLADAQQMLERIEALPEGVHMRAAMRAETLRALFTHDPAVALDAAATDPAQLARYASKWALADRAALDRWLESRSGDERATVLAGIATSQLGTDAAAAATQITELSGLELGGAATDQVAAAAGSVADSLAGGGFARATDWVATLEEGAVAESAAAAVTKRWVSVDAAAASAWIRELSSGSTRDAAAGVLAGSIVASNPASALDWTRSISAGPSRDSVIEGAMRELLSQDPSVATQWIDLADSDDVRAGLSSDLADAWYETDRAAALEWIESLPAGPQRDAANYTLIDHELQHGLPAALQLAHSLDNDLYFEDVMDNLSDIDPGELRSAVESLPAGSRRQQLLEALK